MATTYTIPDGLSLRQKKALAALIACAPCCSGSGQGSGAGSGTTGPNSELCCGYCTDGLTNNSPPATLEATVTSCAGTQTVTLTQDRDCDNGLGLSYSYTSAVLVDGSCLAGGIPTAWNEVADLQITIYCDPAGSHLRWQAFVQHYSTTAHALMETVDYNSGLLQQGVSYGPDACGVEANMQCDPFYLYVSMPVYRTSHICDDLVEVNFNNTLCDDCDGSTITLEVTL